MTQFRMLRVAELVGGLAKREALEFMRQDLRVCKNGEQISCVVAHLRVSAFHSSTILTGWKLQLLLACCYCSFYCFYRSKVRRLGVRRPPIGSNPRTDFKILVCHDYEKTNKCTYDYIRNM
jgi:hypothetical protein